MQNITLTGTLQFTRGLKAALPATGKMGQPFYCTDTHELYVWDGAEMVLLNGATGSGGGTGATLIKVTGSGVDMDQALPDASSNDGMIITVKRMDALAGAIRVATADGDVYLTNQFQYVMVQSDGTGWQIIGGN